MGKETDLASRRALAQANFELAELTLEVGREEDALAAHRQVLAARVALAAGRGADIETRVGLLEFLFRVFKLVRIRIEGGLFLHPPPPQVRVRSHGLLEGKRFPVLACLALQGPRAVDGEFVDHLPEFLQADFEELLPLIDLVDLLLDEPPVQGRLQGRGIVGLQHGVHVEGERHAGIAQFPDSFGGIDPSREPDLVDVLAERPEVGNNVDVALLRLLGHRDRFLALLLGLGKLDVQFLQLNFESGLFRLARFLELFPEFGDGLVDQIFLALGLLDGFLDFFLGPLLLPDLLTNRPLFFLEAPLLELLDLRLYI